MGDAHAAPWSDLVKADGFGRTNFKHLLDNLSTSASRPVNLILDVWDGLGMV
jgi:hypothetical protein